MSALPHVAGTVLPASPCSPIAFVVNGTESNSGDIAVACADGSGFSRLTDGAASDDLPAWSPDGAYIAFARAEQGPSQIYVMEADGSRLRQVTSDYSNAFPIWLPGGQEIAFESTDNDGLWWWRAIQADGSGATRQLTEPSYDWFFQTQRWSPDGLRVAYMSLNEQQARNDGSSQIHIRDADGTHDAALNADVWANVNPLWS
ncbi:MAG: hypothetical protein ABI847_07720, partial [Anaerolineales bacterium]